MDTEETHALIRSSKLVPDGLSLAKSSATQIALQRLEVNLVPDEVEMTLKQPVYETVAESMRPLWHRVTPKPGALVSLWSRDDKLHVVRLSAQSNAPGWKPSWCRWTYAVRRTPKDLGGDALAAQDLLSPDGLELTLLVLPGEQRSATLEFVAEIDGETYPDNYPFEIVMRDVEDDAVATTPGLLRLRHPSTTLLNYLPAIYSQAPTGPGGRYAPYEDKPFFERFLTGFQDAMEPTQNLLSGLAEYFDADAAPADFLPWLGTWVSLVLDDNWPELKRRRLIKEAVELYRWRGTRHGLSRYLEIYTGVIPEINDKPFQGMRLGQNTRLGVDTILGDVPPHTFVITLAVSDLRGIKEQILRDIIESEKPAHTAYELRIVTRDADEN